MDLSRLMMLEARIEMEDGRPSNGREIMRDVLALAGHIENLEAQSLIDHSHVMILRSQRARWLLEQAPVADANTLDTEMMRSFVAIPDRSAERVAHLIRGEWNSMASTLGHMFIDMIDEGQLPDGVAMARLQATHAAEQIRKLEAQGNLVDFQAPPEPAIPDDMSDLAKEIIEMQIDSGPLSDRWLSGARRQHLLRDMQFAVIQLWESEREGLPLPSEVTEPVSGRSFRVDPEARTIFPPEHAEGEDAPNIDPIVLPRRE